MKPKDVLDNFRGDPCEPLRKVIWDALTILQNEKYATRAYLAQQCLEDGLKEHGWPDHDGDDPYGASNG